MICADKLLSLASPLIKKKASIPGVFDEKFDFLMTDFEGEIFWLSEDLGHATFSVVAWIALRSSHDFLDNSQMALNAFLWPIGQKIGNS